MPTLELPLSEESLRFFRALSQFSGKKITVILGSLLDETAQMFMDAWSADLLVSGDDLRRHFGFAKDP